jgi:hypothetical protein
VTVFDPGLSTKTGTRKFTYGSFDGAMFSLPPDSARTTVGWLDSSVCLQEGICDVAATSHRNSIDDALSIAYWKDSVFDHNEYSFNFIRVLEVATDHWTTYDAFRKG